MNSRLLFLISFILPLLLVACRAGDVTARRNPEGGIDITSRLTEADVNTVIGEVLAEVDNTLLRDPQVDLQNGIIVINGEHDRRSGEGRVAGSLTATMTVQDGALLVQVTEVNIEDVTLDDARISRINERLANRFQLRADPDSRAVNFTSVTITDETLEITLNARRQ
ncbi:MAG: hypothetical protein OHK0046_44810 [Anaerolineae bacterium]